jgi:hypothetical protein
METKAPTLEEWRALYQAASAFRDIESWRWMADSYVFGVQNPAGGETAYCCVMGALGQLLGLAAYLGRDGLETYEKLRSGETPIDDEETMFTQRCLMACFGDRRGLQKPDLQVIKQLGLKFRGDTAWPWFRSYRPGYFPWYLEPAEAQFLTAILEQAREVTLRFKEDPSLLSMLDSVRGKYFMRVPERQGEHLVWRDAWLEPAPLAPREKTVGPIDELRLARVKQEVQRRPGIWEIDLFYSPMTIKEKTDERPYYPPMMLWVDQHSGMILMFHLFKPEEYPLQVTDRCLDMFSKIRIVPEEIWVKREEAFEWLQPLAARLDVRLSKTRRLPQADRARQAMMDRFF